MELKKGKVYKIKHVKTSNWEWERSYIICSPIQDMYINDAEMTNRFFRRQLLSFFIVCFDKGIKFASSTTIYPNCIVEEITSSDYEDMRKVIDKYNILCYNKMLYNRKKNCLVFK